MRFLKSSSSYISILSLSILCIVETLCFTHFQQQQEWRANTAMVYFVSGILICLVACFFALTSGEKKIEKQPDIFWVWGIKIFVSVIFFGFVCFLFISLGKNIFPVFHAVMEWADMLPLIQTACERLIHGEEIYKPVHNIWGGETAIPYLPGMWLPYVPFVFWGIDMRWANIVFTLLGFALLFIIITGLEWRKYFLAVPIVFFLVVLSSIFLTSNHRDFYLLTEEAIPAFYYLLLFIVLMLGKDWIIGVAFALCTISRFSLLPFFFFFCLWLAINKHYTRLFRIITPYAIVLLALFIFPFFIQQPAYFLQIPFKYLDNKDAFWIVNNYTIEKIPGLGLAYFCGYANRHILAMLYFPVLVAIPFFWLLCFQLLQRTFKINQNIWAMAGLKLSLVFFYNFVGVPQFYLFMVPTLVSYPLLLAVIKDSDL